MVTVNICEYCDAFNDWCYDCSFYKNDKIIIDEKLLLIYKNRGSHYDTPPSDQ